MPDPAGALRQVRAGSVQHTENRTHHDRRAVHITKYFYGNVGSLEEVRRDERAEYDDAWLVLRNS